MSYLKSKTVKIESIGDKLLIQELSAKAQAEFIETYNDEKRRYLAGAVSCKYGVPDWSEKSPEDIAAMLSMAQIGEICDAIAEINPPKNSESTPIESSSSN